MDQNIMDPDGKIRSSCHTWEINKFSLRCDAINSPVFYGGIRDKSQSTWYLQLYPNGDGSTESKGFISLYLYLETCLTAEVEVNYELSIVNQELTRCEKIEARDVLFSTDESETRSRAYGYSEFISRERLMDVKNKFLRDDVLTISCRLWGLNGRNQVIVTPVFPADEVGISSLRTILWEQYLQKKFVDITFDIQGTEFKLHKNFLAAYSAVFSAMFESDMLEAKDNKVMISDCGPEEFEEMVKFLYLGKADNLKKYHFELLAIAEKYSLVDLKDACEKSISSDLTNNNAFKSLYWADLHRATCLKLKVLDYIKMNATEVVNSEDWCLLVNEPKLLREVFCALATLGEVQ